MSKTDLALDALAREIEHYPIEFLDWLTDDALHAYITKQIIVSGCTATMFLLVFIVFLMCAVNCHKKIPDCNNLIERDNAKIGRLFSLAICGLAFVAIVINSFELLCWIFIPGGQLLEVLM